MSAQPDCTKHAEAKVAALAALYDHLKSEGERTAERRALLFGDGAAFEHDAYLEVPSVSRPGTWALAMSGGGIRSATFCLGVLQELARPSEKAIVGIPPQTRAAFDKVHGLLPQFDYVSSVSGGGFTAGFMQTLYAKQPQNIPPADAARTVNRCIAQEPPPRVHSNCKPSPLAWLRENGRYLAPSGAGDMSYAIGFSVRNWLGIQSVIGAPLLLATAVLAFVAQLIADNCSGIDPAWWWVPLVVYVGWILPTAGAYWMTRNVAFNRTGDELPMLRVACVFVAGCVIAWLGGPFGSRNDDHACWLQAKLHPMGGVDQWRIYLLVSGAVLLLTVAWAVIVRVFGPRPKCKGDFAVTLTHMCTAGIKTTMVLLALVVILELAHEVLLVTGSHTILLSGGAAGILAIAYRAIMKLLPLLRGAGSSLGHTRGIPRRTLSLALSILGLLILFLVGIFWSAAAQWLMRADGAAFWASKEAQQQTAFEALATVDAPSVVTVACLAAAFVLVAGRWPSILNMSGYHHFYSSRLTRAYLGAANPLRTTAAPPPVDSKYHATDFNNAGVARFAPGDLMSYDDYHAHPAAPLHLINVTLNQTVDRAEQLVQRDRKGKPLVVLPLLTPPTNPSAVHVAIDGALHCVTGAGAELSIGDWLAVSGAAVSTGMGRQTSAGAAICVTMANARVGRWWEGPDGRDGFWRSFLPTYVYLFDEMLARFQGAHRRLLYLTDGGHFDNTGIYELLRRVRNKDTSVRLVFLCDCGADAEYRYDDLANLVRLARVDFQLEIEVEETVTKEAPLSEVFGTPCTMRAADPARLDTRCAILLNVRDAKAIVARIVLIKPRLIACVSSDLLGYYRNNPVFPQQTTGDQFFDDEQWESYRKLGVECCRLVLDLGQPLWKAVL